MMTYWLFALVFARWNQSQTKQTESQSQLNVKVKQQRKARENQSTWENWMRAHRRKNPRVFHEKPERKICFPPVWKGFRCRLDAFFQFNFSVNKKFLLRGINYCDTTIFVLVISGDIFYFCHRWNFSVKLIKGEVFFVIESDKMQNCMIKALIDLLISQQVLFMQLKIIDSDEVFQLFIARII